MAWPTGQDYNEAIQSPQTVFADADLKGGRAESNQHGFPRPRAGAFATVYRIENGGRAWAVRCFNRDTSDLQERYSAISGFLKRETLPYFAEFEYLQQGIRVKGTWYPILKMEWLRGDPLNVYIEKHLKDSASLLRLSSDWLQMAKSLANAGIAHGDLQHGNVLLVGSRLKLIDYDGMYVPTLSGKLSNEMGQPNYQLPNRTAYDYGPELDNFSEWVVLVSILALCADPTLWKTFRGGDECLLFRKNDFEKPATSQLFRALERSNDQQVAALVRVFKTYLSLNPSAVPSIDGSFVKPVAPQSASPGNSPDWLKDHLGAAKVVSGSASATKSEQLASVFAGDWLLDFTAPQGISIRFEGSFVRDRITILIALAVTILLYRFRLSLWTELTGPILWASAFLVLRRGYRSRPETFRLTAIQRDIAIVESELSDASAGLDRSIKDREVLRNAMAEKKRLSDRARGTLQGEEPRKSSEAVQRNQSAVKQLVDRLNILSTQEATDLANIQKNLGATLMQRKTELAALDQAETTERAALLKQKCDLYMTNALSSASIGEASISGVGSGLKKELWRSGIRSALQVDRWRVIGVKGIGSAKADALVTWRATVEQQARLGMPALTAQEKQTIIRKYESQRTTLRDEIANRGKIVDSEQRSVRTRCASMKASLGSQIKDAETALNLELRAIVAEFANRYAKFDSDARAETDQSLRELSVIDNQVADATRTFTGIQWRMGKIQRERKIFDNVTFKAFIRRTLIGR